MGRLLTVTQNGSLVEEYSYDLNGGRTSEINVQRNIAGRSFYYSDEDHLLAVGNTSYQYDLDGFLTTRIQGTEVTTYSYSSRGELLSVSLPDGRLVEYMHDPLGRRIAKKINGATVEKYLWAGLTKLLAVYDGSDNLIMRFEYADARIPMAMTSGGAVYYLAYDQVGSLRVVADASGNIVKSIEYDSFGNVIADSNPLFEMPFGFAGGLQDKDTGLVRFGARDFDPDIGRWTAKDPILFASGDTDLYGYCLSDPINFVDPEGLAWFMKPNDPHVFGRNNGTGFFAAGAPVMKFLERLPNMHQTAVFHDAVVDSLKTGNRIIDEIVNVATMSPVFKAAAIYNLAAPLSSLQQSPKTTINMPSSVLIDRLQIQENYNSCP